MRLDIETLLDSVETFVKAKLNTKLLEIDAEKSDGITLLPVSDDAYILQTMSNDVANHNPFLFYGLEDPDSTGIGPATSHDIPITVLVVLVDDGDDLSIFRRMLRYGRALTEIFEKDWYKVNRFVNFEVESKAPVSYTFNNSGENYRVVGVRVRTTFA